MGANNHDKVDFNDLLNKGVNNLLKLDYVYGTGDTEKKREVISSMYPEKMTFDGFSVRTNRINEVARLIYSMDVGSSENKNRTNQNNSSLSCQVGAARFELATSTSQMWRDNRATLRPEVITLRGQGLRRGWDSNPRYSLTRTTI